MDSECRPGVCAEPLQLALIQASIHDLLAFPRKRCDLALVAADVPCTRRYPSRACRIAELSRS